MAGDRSVGDFGGKLRDARERRGISLRQIANATKISITALEALERNDISRLPGGIFSRAFVRSYAVEVGLDPEATIHEFIAQFPNDPVTAGHPTSDRVEDHEAVESERRTAGTFLWLAVVSIPVAATLIYFATAGRRQNGAGASEPGARERSIETPTPPSSQPKFSEDPQPAASAPPSAAAGGPAVSPAPPTSSASAASASAPPPAAAPAPEPAGAAATPAGSETSVDRLSVQLAATRPCWVSAVVDGRKQMDRLMATGERATLDVRREIVLTAGDAEALRLTFNGAAAKPLGTAGEIVSRRFTPENFKSYLQNR
jgi:cytoskeleton protein RodZ